MCGFGTHNGLMRYYRRTGQWFTYRETRLWGRVQALARDDNILWIGSERGLAMLDIKADSLDYVQGSEYAIINALVAGPDYIWAGTESGLFSMCPRGFAPGGLWPIILPNEGYVRWRCTTAICGLRTEATSAVVRYRPGDDTWREYPLTEIGGERPRLN